MQNNPMLGQVLGGLFGQAMRRRGGGPEGGGLGGLGGLGGSLGGVALGSVLAGMMRNRGQSHPAGVPGGTAGGGRPYANQTALLMMLLPLAMRWVQKNGGMGSVLDRFRQKGFGPQAQSWVGTGHNDVIDERAVEQVVGQGELRQMAQRLGVPEHEVAQALAEIMPEMADKLSPEGRLPQHADEVLEDGRHALEQEIQDVRHRDVTLS
jgi:uncharacterized protein YidB (DUF937 family)